MVSILLLGGGLTLIGLAGPALPSTPDVILEDFQGLKVGVTPKGAWTTRKESAEGIYTVAEETGNRYLHAKDVGQSVQFFREGGWDIQKYPRLKWKWRVHRFPKGADESASGKNDSAAAIYVVFPRRFFVPEAIKYAWSQVVPEETVIIRKYKRFPMVIVKKGKEPLKEWVEFERDVYRDFKKLFGGRTPPNPLAIGVLTDANGVKGVAEADYDDFRVSK